MTEEGKNLKSTKTRTNKVCREVDKLQRGIPNYRVNTKRKMQKQGISKEKK